MTIQERNKVLQWVIEDKCQYDSGEWKDYPFSNDGTVCVHLTESFSSYRIKPTPALRPWRPEEVPVGALLRTHSSKDGFIRHLIVGLGHDGEIKAGPAFSSSFQWALNECEHSLDHGKTWLPCGVMEE